MYGDGCDRRVVEAVAVVQSTKYSLLGGFECHFVLRVALQ
jgi:hypothetical protein